MLRGLFLSEFLRGYSLLRQGRMSSAPTRCLFLRLNDPLQLFRFILWLGFLRRGKAGDAAQEVETGGWSSNYKDSTPGAPALQLLVSAYVGAAAEYVLPVTVKGRAAIHNLATTTEISVGEGMHFEFLCHLLGPWRPLRHPAAAGGARR